MSEYGPTFDQHGKETNNELSNEDSKDVVLPDDEDEEDTERKIVHKIFKVEFEDGTSVEMPYSEKEVRFPEHLVEETDGVLGYTRRLIRWEDYKKVISEIPREKKNHILDKIFEELGENVLTTTNIHTIGRGYTLRSRKESGEKIDLDREFSKHMLTQIIYDPAVTDRQTDDDPDDPRTYFILKDYLFNNHWSFNPRYYLNPKQIIELLGGEYKEETITEDFLRLLNKNHLMALPSPTVYHRKYNNRDHQRLSLSCGGIWYASGEPARRGSELYLEQAFFGFSGENKAFVRYVTKMIDEWEYGECTAPSLTGDLHRHHGQGQHGELFEFLDGQDSAHIYLSVILGHPDIPNLRWCHASHAYIPTKNGMNFCKMISSPESKRKIEPWVAELLQSRKATNT